MDSSTNEWPSVNTPSTAIFSPGLTLKISPRPTSSIAISCSTPSRITRAVRGCKPISSLIADEVWPLAFVSNAVPKFMNAKIMTEASK